MFLTLTSTATSPDADAADLGFLLHKHPERVQQFELPFGVAHVHYPEASAERCTVALHVEVDPIALVRGKRWGSDGFALGQYVNDRPYAASSLLAVALGKVFGTALTGRCAARPELEGHVLALTVHVPSVSAHGGPDLVRRLFEPLGWSVEADAPLLDPTVPRWGEAPYVDLTLTGETTVAAALAHLYVLLPALDGAKHYWVGPDEVDKLVRRGGDWLADHPERGLIATRYLARRQGYVTDALSRLAALDEEVGGTDDAVDDSADPAAEVAEVAADDPEPLSRLRARAVIAALHDAGAHRVVDLGCGEGALLRDLLTDPTFTEVVGVDVSATALARAEQRIERARLGDRQHERLRLRQSSATYRDRALEGYDAVVLMEVIEHLDLERLPDLERSVLGHARPAAVVVTTPNAEHNVLYPRLAAGTLRHRDHRFEWTRAEFAAWAETASATYGYTAELRPVGAVDAVHGPPTQLAILRRASPTVATDGDLV